MTIGRNEACPCGSGLKYKKCCLGKNATRTVLHTLLLAFCGVILLVCIVLVIKSIRDYEPSGGSKRIWSEEHQHWHQAQ